MINILKYCGKLVSFSLFGLALFTACELDYKDVSAISPENVWTNKNMIVSYLDNIHGGMMPGWPFFNGNNNDEGFQGRGSMSDYARGIIGADKDGKGFSYEYIDRVNFFLDKLTTVPADVLTDTENKKLQGQALFWRAWKYWDMVKEVGGVPLILKPQDVNDRPSLFLPRNKTSECVAQILKDLDDAISYLPDSWNGNDYGRIDKGAAMAFKGRVLMWYASPLFNPNNDAQRWQEAYQANYDAVKFLEGIGKGLYPDYTTLWEKEQNEEAIMVNQFYDPDHAYFLSYIRPNSIAKDYANVDMPILSLLLAYPLKDGSRLVLDKARLASDEQYNADFLTEFYMNRDDRFYTTIFCGGMQYPSADMGSGMVLEGGKSLWATWRIGDDGEGYKCMTQDEVNVNEDGSSGFWSLKGNDKSIDKNLVYHAETDWIEIRFAEVLMNYGECANEVGKADEALNVLYRIRQRAGIEAGTGNYGITASTKEAIRRAYMDERLVEFAFEGKRTNDLRRWKRWDILNNMKHRQSIYVVLKDNRDLEGFDWTAEITDPEIRSKFRAVFIENLDGGEQYVFNYDLNHWFYPIAKNDMDRNSQLEQNNEWGGSFDPLQ